MNLRIIVCCLLAAALNNGQALAQHQQGRHQNRSESRPELEARVQELEARLEQMAAEKAKQEQEDRLKQLLDAAKSGKSASDTPQVNRVFKGEGRQQSQLNPEISVTGDFFGSLTSSESRAIIDGSDAADGRNTFNFRDLGISFIAPLDPFTRGKFFLGIPGDGDLSLSEIMEEAYMEWLNLPGGMNLKVGKFNNQFGILNRYHEHGLPQVDRPGVFRHLFGNDMLGGFGVAGNFMVPGLWADVNELDIEIIAGGDGFAYDDELQSVIGVAHLKNYYDLTDNTYLELGFSGAHGLNEYASRRATTLAGADLTCKWVPAGRSHYRTTEFRSELIMSRVEDPAGDLERFGFYSYITDKRGPKHWYGIRFGYTQLPYSVEEQAEWDISPTIDYWQSEFVMWRIQYSYTDRDYDEEDHAVFLHAVWSMGPHKHEAY